MRSFKVKKSHNRKSQLIFWSFFVLLIIGSFLIKGRDYTGISSKADRLVSEQLKKYYVTDSNLLKEIQLKKSHLKSKWLLLHKEYDVPNNFPLKKFSESLEKTLNTGGFNIIKKEKTIEDEKETLALQINFKSIDVYYLKLFRHLIEVKRPYITRPVKPARIAIVIDDWGYNLNNLEFLSDISQKLTLAILPNLTYSTQIAKLAASVENREVIVHLPMEPHDSNLRLEENTIMSNMDKRQILSILNKALISVPYAKGFSNHRGSKATEDKNLIKIIFTEIKKRNLFFLDSLATNKSTAEEISKDLNIKFAKRSIFLDNIDEPAYIKRQLVKLVNAALRTGQAVGIGHDRAGTLKVLKETLPEFEANGIEIVFVSELAEG